MIYACMKNDEYKCVSHIFLEERRNKIQSELSYDLFSILQRFLIEYDICILISLAMQFLQK